MAKRNKAVTEGEGKTASPKKVTGQGTKKPKAAPAAGRTVDSEHNDAMRELFLQHRGAWNELQAKKRALEKIEAGVKGALKADGFFVKQMQIADELITLKGEVKVSGEVKMRLQVARWIGHKLGSQLDLFADAPEHPLDPEDDGKQAAMENLPAKPPHAPGTDAYDRWMAGYHEEQGRQVRAGIKPLEPAAEVEEDESEDDVESTGWGASRMPAAAAEESDL